MNKKISKTETTSELQDRAVEIYSHEKLYNSRNPFVRWLVQKKADIVSDLAKEKGGYTLDAGCGEGYILKKLKGNPYAIDVSKKRIELAKKRVPNAKFYHGDLCKRLPFKDNFFNNVICADVLEHLKEPEKAAKELKRVTKKGGHIIVSVPNELNQEISKLFMLRFPLRATVHLHSFKPKDLDNLFGSKPSHIQNIPNLPFLLCIVQIRVYEK